MHAFLAKVCRLTLARNALATVFCKTRRREKNKAAFIPVPLGDELLGPASLRRLRGLAAAGE